ncbi:MAG: hypothetical protein IJD57_07205 [Candidatus Gastranaerophilales bacterium]|nr:hypothetical protein [Candidatus Gastranaerophilales bacterium]
MKIGNIQNFYFISNKNIDKKFDHKKDYRSSFKFPKINSKYYRANSNISFAGQNNENKIFPMPLIKNDEFVGYTFPIKLTKNKINNLEISKEFFNDYLCDKNGKFQQKTFAKYVEAFNCELMKEFKKEVQMRNYLLGILQEENVDIQEYIGEEDFIFLSGEEIEEKIVEQLNQDKDALRKSVIKNLANKVDSDEFVKNVLQSLPKGPLRISMAKEMLRVSTPDKIIKNSFKTAQSNTTALFKLSKTEDGFDFSNNEQKAKISKLSADFEGNFNITISLDEMIKMSNNLKGKTDLDFIELCFTLLRYSEGLSGDFTISNYCNVVNKLTAFGNLEDKEFVEFIKFFAKDSYLEEKDIKKFELALNPQTKQFDLQYAQKYKEAYQATIKWIVRECEALEEVIGSKNMCLVDDYYFNIAEFNILKDYLEYSHKTDNPISIEDFLSKNGSKYKFENQ